MPSSSLSGRRCVVVGGAGAVGGMFVDLLLADGADVCIVDVRDAGRSCSFEHGDITAPGPTLLAELRSAELVVLALPEQVALAAVSRVAEALVPGALLVDTTSVKSEIVEALDAHATHLEAVSLNPMFAPSLGIEGRPVVAVVVHDGPRVQELLRLLGRHGARVVELTADEHDRLTSATQALTHATVLAFGLALADLDVDIADLAAVAPPPHVMLLALLARITSGAPETYWDVQAANPHAWRARAALAAAVRRVADVVDKSGEAEFGTVLTELRSAFDGDVERYRELCAHVFRTIQQPER